MLLSNLLDGLGSEQGAACAAKRAVGHDMDALLLAQVDNLLLRKSRVILDLVDSRDNLGLGQQLLKVLLAVLFNDRSAPAQECPPRKYNLHWKHQ